jgi:hypothetical protein
MTITRETVQLADRHPKDLEAIRAQHAKIKQLELAAQDFLRKHARSVLEERGKLHRLEGAARVSGGAVRELELTVPRELQDAIEAAGRDARVLAGRAIELQGSIRNAKATLDRLVAAKAPKPSIAGAKATLEQLERELAALRAQVKKVDARLEAARKAERSAIEAARKEALEG